MSLFDLVRQRRLLITSGNAKLDLKDTLYLGLYNAEPFWGQIENNVLCQSDLKESRVVIVDNCSSDSTWELASELATKLPNGATLARNSVNLGGTGSLFANLDLIETAWFTTLHQDDVYFPNHLSTHIDLITKASDNVAFLTTEMSHLSSKGGIGIFPRGSWFLADKSRTDLYLAHLKFHVAPFPAASFRKEALCDLLPTLHNTAFPDTEMVLQLLSNWDIEIHDFQTMAYRENPSSESHILDFKQKEYGQFMGLLKHFGGQSFENFARNLSPEDRDAFAQGAIESIRIRFKSDSHFAILRDLILERLAQIWDYNSDFVGRELAIKYSMLGSKFAEEFLSNSRAKLSQRAEAICFPRGEPDYGFIEGKAPNISLRAFLVAMARLAARLLNSLGKRRDVDFRWRR